MPNVDLTGFAIALIVLGVVAAVGSTILLEYRDSQLDDIATYQVKNETVTDPVNGTYSDLALRWVQSIGTITNATTGQVVGTANYTTRIRGADGVGQINASHPPVPLDNVSQGNWNVTYTVYNITDARFKIADDASTGLAEYGDWFKVLVVIAVAALVIGLLFSSMRGGAGSEGGGTNY